MDITAEQVTYLRLLIGDTDSQILTDEELKAFAGQETSLKLAGAAILDAIAVNAVLVMRKITSQDITLDGPAVAAELRAQAKALRQQHADDQAAADDGWGFVVVDYPPPGAPAPHPELAGGLVAW